MSDLRLSLLALGVVVLIGIYAVTRRTLRKDKRRNFKLGKFDEDAFDDDILKDYYYEPKTPPGQRQEPVMSAPPAAAAPPAAEPVAEPPLAAVPRQVVPANVTSAATGGLPRAAVAGQRNGGPATAALRPVRNPATPASGAQATAAAQPELLVVMFLIARGEAFTGYCIDQAMRYLGLEPDQKGMYQKYVEDDDGATRPLLGVANALEPGTIDFQQLAAFSTTGLVVYMRLPGPGPGVECFDRMFVLTRELADMLDAEVRDDRQSVLTIQTLGHLRERIHDFELRRLMAQGRRQPEVSPRR